MLFLRTRRRRRVHHPRGRRRARRRCDDLRGNGRLAPGEIGVHGLLHVVGRGKAVVRVFLQRAHDDGVELRVYLRVDLGRRDGRVVNLLHRHRHHVRAVEGQLAGGRLVHDDAQRVEVAGRAELFALRLLGADVVRRAEHRGIVRHAGVARLRDAKVHDLHVAVGLDHDVGGLDVAVDDVVAVRDAQRRAHLRGYLGDLARVNLAPLLDGRLQVRAAHVLHDDVVGIVVAAPVVDVDDVGALQVGGRLGLLAKARGEGAVCRVLRKHDLERDGAAERAVRGLVDLGHAAHAYLFKHLVPVAVYSLFHSELLLSPHSIASILIEARTCWRVSSIKVRVSHVCRRVSHVCRTFASWQSASAA